MKQDDKAAIEQASEALQQALSPVMQKAQAAAQQAGAQSEAPANNAEDDDVVDAEFEEVDDKK